MCVSVSPHGCMCVCLPSAYGDFQSSVSPKVICVFVCHPSMEVLCPVYQCHPCLRFCLPFGYGGSLSECEHSLCNAPFPCPYIGKFQRQSPPHLGRPQPPIPPNLGRPQALLSPREALAPPNLGRPQPHPTTQGGHLIPTEHATLVCHLCCQWLEHFVSMLRSGQLALCMHSSAC